MINKVHNIKTKVVGDMDAKVFASLKYSDKHDNLDVLRVI